MNIFLIVLILFAMVEYSTNNKDGFKSLKFSEKIKTMLKSHAIFYSLFMTLSFTYYFFDNNEFFKEKEIEVKSIKVNKLPIKNTKQQSNWKYLEYEGNKIASLQSSNAVNIIPQNLDIKETYLYIEHLNFNDNSEQSYIKITKSKGRHPCWDEDQYCHLDINGIEFKLKKGENFQEMQIENDKEFIKIVKENLTVKITTPMTIQPVINEAFVENRDFFFTTK